MEITEEIYKNRLIPAGFDSDTSSSIYREKNFIPAKSETSDASGSFFLTPERIQDKKDEIETFNRLIKKRIEYLDELENLNDDWITGKSIAPNKYVLELSKDLLLDVSKLISEYKYLPIPKLLIGPIPTGGLSIEFIVSENKKILINIYNNKTCELEYEKDGFYQEVIPLEGSSLSNQLVYTYLSLA